MTTRRQFLQAGLAAGAGLAGAGLLRGAGRGHPWEILVPRTLPAAAASPAITRWLDPLPRPPVAPKAASQPYAGADYYEIAMQQRPWQFHTQLAPTPAWGYWAGGVGIGCLGPTIEARTNRPVVVKYANDLPTTHLFQAAIDPTLWDGSTNDPPGGRDKDEIPAGAYVRCCPHLHGGFNPPQFDGLPESWFTPDGRHGPHYVTLAGAAANEAVLRYGNQQRATMLWFHDHGLAITRLNVYAGLAALYLLRDGVEDALDIPRGPYEIPIIVQDKTFSPNGALFYPTTGITAVHPIWVPEFFGDTPVVNGKAYPFLSVEPRRYRLRFLNGSNARFYHLWFEDTKTNAQFPFHVIGTEGGFLPAPVRFDGMATKLLLAPAERFDVIMDFSAAAGRTLTLFNNAKAPYPGGRGGMVNQILQLRVGTTLSTPDSTTPAAQLALPPIPRLTPTPGAPKRQIILKEDMDPATGEPIHVRLNQRWYFEDERPEDIDEHPTVGTTEVWQFVNATADAHPMHVHLVMFQVVDRQPFAVKAFIQAYLAWVDGGRVGPAPDVTAYLTGAPIPPPPEERGWKDTVKALPGQITRIIATFDVPPQTTLPAEYVYHCHILEHEDNEMMRPYKVLPPA